MNDKEIRYNRNFLNWDESDFQIKSILHRPKFHINPSIGLINDPNCVFWLDGTLYIFFQHHPANPLHGLKTMSLAKTKDMVNFEYIYMVNKPDNDFESHGVYSGNAIVYNNVPICIYTGNKRDQNWDRTSSVVISRFDIIENKFIEKRVLITNKDFKSYTEHFRDPYIFNHEGKLYFLLGAQDINNNGKILLFSLNENLDEAYLLNEISFKENYRMIECPNIVIKGDKVLLIYSPQYDSSKIDKSENPDVVRYAIISIHELFSNKIISEEKKVDYGFEYYAPQTFTINNKWYIIGWVGTPTSNNYLENTKGWIHSLSNIREIKFNGNSVSFCETDSFVNSFKNPNLPSNIFYQSFKLGKSEFISFDGEEDFLSISYKSGNLIFVRNSKIRYYQYKNISNIKLNSENAILDIYYDNSILEIKINNELWFTSRLYLGNKFKVRINNES